LHRRHRKEIQMELFAAAALIVYILVVVAVFKIASATARTAEVLARVNTRMRLIVSHLGIDEDQAEPPCGVCLASGKEVRLIRAGAELKCPVCKFTRIG